jgi:hypothetical protein
MTTTLPYRTNTCSRKIEGTTSAPIGQAKRGNALHDHVLGVDFIAVRQDPSSREKCKQRLEVHFFASTAVMNKYL